MALLTLENIGKIYVSEGAVSVGIRGVNLSFDAGEFVAITGKSGSGKTTLLNTISGMDSYEEGELYIDGQPTSHYTQADWEAYREKYISFIFQDYNIIDSFTVLQNVELALMYIPSRHERHRRALALIDRVGMTPFRHHRGSKLSGGQKQRTVIARALAKDSPIILADEPTGNLDSESAKEVIALLKEVSADKLVIVVTHNFDQVADCATREIRVFDGQIERDERIRETTPVTPRHTEAKPATKGDTLRRGIVLGWHRFRATPRLTTFICFVMLLALLGTFALTSYLIAGTDSDTEQPLFGYVPGRLILSHRDESAFSEEELAVLAKVTKAERTMRYDHLLDQEGSLYMTIPDTSRFLELAYRFSCDLGEITSHPNTFSPDAGVLPTGKDDVFLYLPISWEQIFGRGVLRSDTISVLSGSKTLQISGVKYYYNNRKTAVLYMTNDGFENLSAEQVPNANSGQYEFTLTYPLSGTAGEGKQDPEDVSQYSFGVVRCDDSLAAGTVAVSMFGFETFVANGPKTVRLQMTQQAYDRDATIVFGKEAVSVDLARSRELSEILNENWYGTNALYVSPDIWGGAFAAAAAHYGQASLFFSSDRAAAHAAKMLTDLTADTTAGLTEEEKTTLDSGYFAVRSDAYYTDANLVISTFFTRVFKYAAWLFLILFLSLFLTLCYTRGVNTLRGDLGILRSMGISAGVIRVSSYAQTFYAMTPAVVVLGASAFVIYRLPKTNAIFPFLGAWHYLLILLGAVILCLRVAGRYNRKIFSQSVRKTLRGGAAND